MDSLRYAYYYGLVSLLRVADGLRIRDMVRLSLEAFPPSQKLEVPSSKDGNRTIKIHVYVPPSAAGKAAERRPVHINWHGSGFVLPSLGVNAQYCAHLCTTHNITVIDADYAKAPEHPFPAALYDSVDVIRWARSQPFCDKDRVTIGGFSAGANLALALAASCGMDRQDGEGGENVQLLKQGEIRHAVAFYPTVDQQTDPGVKEGYWTLPDGVPGMSLPAPIMRIFTGSYTFPHTPASHPLVSPTYAAPTSFAHVPLTIISCGHDPLRFEVVPFVEKLQKAGCDVEHRHLSHVGHAYETWTCPGQPQEKEDSVAQRAVRESYPLVDERLAKVYAQKA